MMRQGRHYVAWWSFILDAVSDVLADAIKGTRRVWFRARQAAAIIGACSFGRAQCDERRLEAISRGDRPIDIIS